MKNTIIKLASVVLLLGLTACQKNLILKEIILISQLSIWEKETL